jgi:hypothetical protein
METERTSRRGFLKGLMALAAGAGVSAITATPAEAQPYRRRWGWGNRRAWRGPRYFGGSRYFGGYRGLGTRYYSSGYYGAPYLAPRPVAPVQPYFSGRNFFPPMM